ncbi:MAG: ATP-binding protein [Paracoccaceae bacterium]|nr:ATP-binding protein [Paracoccaceae bacterium]
MQLANAVLDALPIPALLIDGNERLAHANAEAKAILGGTVVGRTYVAALRQPVLLDCVEAVFRLRQPGTASVVTTVATREVLWRVTAAPLATSDGGPLVLVTFEDQTATQEARQMRQDFVANVSHELRTPLTALIGFIETLKGAARDDAEARDRFLDTMGREATRMNRLVADLLSLSRVESVERMRPTETVDLSAILASVVLALQPLAEEQGAELRLEGAGGEAVLTADPDQLSQVFTNLVENAVKYGAETVTVRLSRHDEVTGFRGPGLEVSVEDDGDGIDAAHIPRLTERFYRVDSHRSREMGGTGLGLAIVKHIVNRHRGRLKIEATPGEGSRFTVLLPALR